MYFVKNKLQQGFGLTGIDVDDFIKFSLSVQNSRKSRVGYALENHLEDIFRINGIKIDRGKVTEHKSKSDFIFPSIVDYLKEISTRNYLTMLGVKTTSKDRWTQVLTEAEKINKKHLLILQPAISTHQTDEMISKSLQLIVPESIISKYTCSQQEWLMTLKTFIDIVKDRELYFI